MVPKLIYSKQISPIGIYIIELIRYSVKTHVEFSIPIPNELSEKNTVYKKHFSQFYISG